MFTMLHIDFFIISGLLLYLVFSIIYYVIETTLDVHYTGHP